MDFVKGVGKKIGIGDDEPEAQAPAQASEAAKAPSPAEVAARNARRADRIRQHLVDDLKLPIAELDIACKARKVTLTGTLDTQATREKAVIAVGNLNGIEQVDDRIEVPDPAPPAVFHTVEKGDTLSKIAREYYGVMRMYDGIFEANTPMLEHPDRIYPGQVLRIPPAAAPAHTVAQGESLSKIAKFWYGDLMKYPLIFDANRDVLDNPNVVTPGQSLRIPLVDPKVEPPKMA